MRYILAILALALLVCSASIAATTPPVGGWGNFNGVESSATGSYGSYGYVYDPLTYTWEMGSETGAPAGFTVTADIEMWCDMYFNATDIYFHIGKDLGPNPKLSQSVAGWLNSNNGMYLFVSKPDFQPGVTGLTQLAFTTDIRNRTAPPLPAVTPIPVKWFLTDTGVEREGTYSTGGNNGQLWGVTWLLDGGSTGSHSFNIRCEISPNQYQEDGDYEMDPILVGSPVL